MKTILRKSLWLALAPLAFAAGSLVFSPVVKADTDRLVIESGDSTQSRQHAAMEKEQWNDTRSLRKKVNTRVEKEWDKDDVAFDLRDKCQQSANVNAYWENNTLRCLDRRTGRTITP